MAKKNIAIPENKGTPTLNIQRDFLPVIDIEPYDEEQQLFRGKILNAHLANLQNASDRDFVYFERNYNPEVNDLDKVFREIRFDDKLVGESFTLIPMNKVRVFWTPASLIQMPTQKASHKLNI